MKTFNILSAVAALSVTALSSSATVAVSNELVVGFSNSTLSNVDVVFNAGTLSTFSAPGTYNLGNWGDLLNSNFGTDWTSVKFSGVAESGSGVGNTEYLSSSWISGAAEDGGTVVDGVLGNQNSATFGTVGTGIINVSLGKIGQVYQGTLKNNTIGTGSSNSFNKNLPFNVTTANVGVDAYNTLGNIVGTDDVHGAFAASDLYMVKASTPAQFVGTLAVYQDGQVTFTVIPEPSTYAIILGALTVGFVALRRRFSRAA